MNKVIFSTGLMKIDIILCRVATAGQVQQVCGAGTRVELARGCDDVSPEY